MFNRFITSAESLITKHEETRTGFLKIVLEKNRAGAPFVKNALAFKAMVAHTRTPEDLLTIKKIRPFLVIAAGLSDKSLAYLNEEDQILAVLRALHWTLRGERILIFNAKIPTVDKNVDLCLFDGNLDDFNDIVRRNNKAIMFGELKGGIDPAGADEHWKTGNSALNRIRTKFTEVGFPKIKTSFIAAATERTMAEEIFSQLQDKTLANAANLTKDDQLAEFCNWLLDL